MYLQSIRWACWPHRSVICPRYISSLTRPPQEKSTGISQAYHTTLCKKCEATELLYRSQRRTLNLSVVKNDFCNCSLCKYHRSKGSLFSEHHENKSRCLINECSVRSFMTTPTNHMFWEKDPKGGFGEEITKKRTELVRDGLKELRTEVAKWQEEVKEKFEDDPIIVRPGDMDKIWVLDSEEALHKFKVTSDSDHGIGESSCSLTLSPTGHGLFSGQLSTKNVKDGTFKRAGYANMTSLRPRKSFKRELCHDWTMYTHLEMRVRGDGRSYLILVSTAGYFDVTWNDVFSYMLFTRGGPHWQIARIPFSKFFLSSKGRVQDKQCPILLEKVVSLGISAGDRINAPFHLEIDYIGVYNDPTHTEKFAYEMYKVPKFMSH